MQWSEAIFYTGAGLLLCAALKLLLSRKKKTRPLLPPSPSWPLPLIGHMHHLIGMGIPRQHFRALSLRLGPIFHLRLGVNDCIVISSAEVAREVFKTHDQVLASRPYMFIGEQVFYNFKGTVFTPYNEHWKRMRKLSITELFTARRIDSFQPVRVREVRNMIVLLLENDPKTPVQLRRLLSAGSFNTITQMVVSKSFHSFDGRGIDADAQEFINVFNEALYQILQFHISEFVPSYLRWIDWTAANAKRLHAKLDKFLQNILDKRRAEKQSAREFQDFMDILLDHTKHLSHGDDIVKAMILVTEIFVGGTETITTTVEWAFAELLQNPGVLEKVREELDRVVGYKPLPIADEPHLEYLQAVIKEVLRLHPPAGLLAPHAALQTCNLAGYNIPKGATIIINAYAISRDPLVWDNPEKFHPERFMGKEIDVKGQNYELLPFGSGRRICPGMGLGLKAVQLLLSNLIHGFNWTPIPGNNYVLEEGDGIVGWLKTPLEILAAPRFPQETYL